MPKITRTRLTQKACDAAIHPDGSDRQHVLWDADQVGLGLRVFPSGAKAWVLRYRVAGKRRLVRLGTYGRGRDQLMLSGARKEARAKQKAVDDGVDPTPRSGGTFGYLCDRYIHEYLPTLRPATAEQHARRIKNRLRPAWGKRSLLSLTKHDVGPLHAAITKTMRRRKNYVQGGKLTTGKVEANRCIKLARAMLYWAVDHDMLPANPLARWKVPKSHKEHSRTRYATDREAESAWAELERLHAGSGQNRSQQREYAAACLKTIVLTGQRKSAVRLMQWSWVSWDRGEIMMPPSGVKEDTPQAVPMSPMVRAILEELWDRDDRDPVWVFKGRYTAVRIDHVWRAIRRKVGAPDLTIHDLRRTVGSKLAQAGRTTAEVGEALGHAPGSMATHIYARMADTTRRECLTEYEGHLLGRRAVH